MTPPSSSPASADRVRVVRPRRRSDPNCALAEIDHRLLGILCAHRVVRQDQLCRLFPEVPERTLRYRTRHLHDLGLAGRSRPYRERGSAPNHHWPTRRADCLMRGDPAPRGGERREPNPMFLAHAAALTELYVAIFTTARAAGFVGFAYQRECDAPEVFGEGASERALAPDARIMLVDEKDHRLTAFVEIDRGTMSHARLRQKAELYTDYVLRGAWRTRHEYLPALLFLTITDVRGRKFLRSLAAALSRGSSSQSRTPFTAGATGIWAPGRLLAEPCFVDLDGTSGLTLVDILNTAREPYEAQLASHRREREAEDERRRELREEPEAMREHLRRHEQHLRGYAAALGTAGMEAFELLLGCHERPSADEAALLRSIARDLGDALLEPARAKVGPPGGSARLDASLLTETYRSIQEREVSALAQRHGVGPGLRRAATRLDSGLLGPRELAALPGLAERDAIARAEQLEHARAYVAWRGEAARRMAREAGPLGRLTHRPEEFHEQIDGRHLKVCRECREIAYPVVYPNGGLDRERTCHYCRDSEHLAA